MHTSTSYAFHDKRIVIRITADQSYSPVFEMVFCHSSYAHFSSYQTKINTTALYFFAVAGRQSFVICVIASLAFHIATKQSSRALGKHLFHFHGSSIQQLCCCKETTQHSHHKLSAHSPVVAAFSIKDIGSTEAFSISERASVFTTIRSQKHYPIVDNVVIDHITWWST